MDNQTIARILLEYAGFLGGHDLNLYRRRAYRRAAEILLRLEEPVERIIEEKGRRGLETLPGIGSHLSYTIEGLVRTGEFRTFAEKRAARESRSAVVQN